MKLSAVEKPHIETAVRATDIITIQAVPSFFSRYPIAKLETAVPEYIIIVMIPALPMDVPRPSYIDGQAAPRIESGSPSDMNAMYIITSRSDAISADYLTVIM